MRENTKKHKWVAILIGLATLLLAACGSTEQAEAPADEGEPIEVELLLSFRPDVQFAPFYVAIENGYWAGAGFDVTITHLSESDIARQVAENDPDDDVLKVGVIGGAQHLLSRAQGLPNIYIFEWYQRFPVAVAAKEGNAIASPSDLVGRSVGVPMREGESYLGLIALLEAQGLSEDDIELEATGFTQVETLATDRVDAVVVYTANEPTILAQQGIPVNVIEIAEYVDLQSNGLIINEARIATQPEELLAFNAAFEEALQYTIDNPDEAFEVSKGYVEGLDDPDIEPTAREVLGNAIPQWEAAQLGIADLESWENVHQILLDTGLLEEPLGDLDAVFTNAFVPGE